MSDPELCSAVVYPATLETPAEFCDNEAVEGEEFCEGHLADYDEMPDDLAYRWPHPFAFDPLEDW